MKPYLLSTLNLAYLSSVVVIAEKLEYIGEIFCLRNIHHLMRSYILKMIPFNDIIREILMKFEIFMDFQRPVCFQPGGIRKSVREGVIYSTSTVEIYI